jgi:SAM-dependent methyltransferase
VFQERGLLQWQYIKSLLPADWPIDGKRVLDFGCGVGRILGAAVAQDPGGDFTGCEVHGPSVDWLREHLSPAHIIQSSEWPPLGESDASFDLIYAFSVFTHLVDPWSAWLLELHRLVKDDGFLVITVFGPGHVWFGDEPITEDMVGMNVLYPSASWDDGGPLVVHSEWWLRAHWGRAFEIVHFEPSDVAGSPPLFGQGVMVMRKRPGHFSASDLESPEPEEPRELEALHQNILSLRREVARNSLIVTSKSWRYTAPLRAAARLLRDRLRAPSDA